MTIQGGAGDSGWSEGEGVSNLDMSCSTSMAGSVLLKNNAGYAGARSLHKSIRGRAMVDTAFATAISLPFFGGISTELRQYIENYGIFFVARLPVTSNV